MKRPKRVGGKFEYRVEIAHEGGGGKRVLAAIPTAFDA